MEPTPEVVNRGSEIRSRLGALNQPTTAAVRSVRKQFSHQLAGAAPRTVLQLALHLLQDGSDRLRFFSYEIVTNHRLTWEHLTGDDLLTLGEGLHSWPSVDCFAMYLSGPMWAEGRLSARTVTQWARSNDLWWRRAALVSTVPLSRRGSSADLRKVNRICHLLAPDKEDMVAKALSWALREMAKKQPDPVREFLAQHKHQLAARIIREVNNKLTTGLKTPRRKVATA